ncbi:rhodanese-like domain-containing protein [Tepidimonas taiwanensis]|uniref:Thiosulfate sulfurtransferase PspE n=1 Tax=Tepidimonas taiwanensis TaxID=307486 RepID=A0A554XC18_9BURK|nr:rhodanese-like domain-containing protein [Tepidimonas taiwanensis]MCX7692592.1 rhodanese-like domain-containing protein [Tepidimonas taiwanensis]MDM7462213.1 rhodanese-like domain-containing protein [Tepidimonas taiwanensis]TSE33319.1 Thiosulfate sulfurtransferase PspE [Tepidimonas taiwanensis]UBQ04361.1 rhodanese-like domain-containing protein [Tepidimonas taiwanensis]
MDFLLQNWMLVAVAVGSAAMLMWPAFSGGAGAGVSPTEAVQLINRDKAAVIDVCTPQEFAQGHVTGARNIPLDALEQQLPQAVKNKATPLVFVCASGVRSRRAVAIAKKLGYERAVSLAGGMAAWRSASLPVQKA